MQQRKWHSFYFDANMIWKLVESQEDWQEVVEAYNGDLKLLKTACNVHCSNQELPPKFGFRRECCGELTLEVWAKEHGMVLFS